MIEIFVIHFVVIAVLYSFFGLLDNGATTTAEYLMCFIIASIVGAGVGSSILVVLILIQKLAASFK